MEQIQVHAIFTTKNATHGTITSPKLILSHIKEMFGEQRLTNFMNKIQAEPNVPFHVFRTFKQYIIRIDYRPNTGIATITMKLTDFHGDRDNALDEYGKQMEDGWNKESRDKIMELYLEIEASQPIHIPMVAVAPDIEELLSL